MNKIDTPMRLIIQVSNKQAAALRAEMEERGYIVTVEDDQDFEVPQWHIDETRRRQALPNQPPPRPWSEIREEFKKRGL